MNMKKFQKNMGTLDRALRFVFAGIIVYLYLDGILHGTLAYVLLLLAIATLYTGISGYCPLYPLFGWNTCKSKK